MGQSDLEGQIESDAGSSGASGDGVLELAFWVS